MAKFWRSLVHGPSRTLVAPPPLTRTTAYQIWRNCWAQVSSNELRSAS